MATEGLPSPYGNCEHFRIQSETLAETQNPIQGAADIYRGFTILSGCYREVFANSTCYSQTGSLVLQLGTKFADDIAFAFGRLEAWEALTVLALTVLWIFARHFVSKFIFRPAAKYADVHEKNVEKFCHSAWICLAYLLMWVISVHVVFYRGYDVFARPAEMFRTSMKSRPPNDLAFLYAVEFSFYLHDVYFTIFINPWSKKNSPMILIHHTFSESLILSSYTVNILQGGALVFVLNDITDALLEGSKAAHYLCERKSGFSPFFSLIEDILSSLLAMTWVYNRLCLHLTKVWRGTALGCWTSAPVLPVPFLLFVNIFLGALYLLQVYWATVLVPYVVRSVIFDSRRKRPPTKTVGSSKTVEAEKDESTKKAD